MTDFNGVSINGTNTGVELVKTDTNEVSFEFLGIDKPSNYKTTKVVKNNIMNISVINSGVKPKNIDVTPGSYENVVRIYIPNVKYKKFDIYKTQ